MHIFNHFYFYYWRWRRFCCLKFNNCQNWQNNYMGYSVCSITVSFYHDTHCSTLRIDLPLRDEQGDTLEHRLPSSSYTNNILKNKYLGLFRDYPLFYTERITINSVLQIILHPSSSKSRSATAFKFLIKRTSDQN